MDLIERKAAIEAVKIEIPEPCNPEERYGIIYARVEARRNIRELPFVPAVPLDRLCDMLGKSETFIPCNLCEYEVNGHQKCTKETKCPCEADDWKRALTKWMEEQNESN